MKIILFGASRGGQNFLKNHAAKYQFIAIVDNDKGRQGKTLNDLPIIDAGQINQYNYDKIIVTSMFVDSISKQLAELGVPKEKIEFASKNSMKVDELPFQNPSILERANQLIVEISTALQHIPYYYTYGTLLGIAREGRLIPWDDDIDVSIFASDIPQIQAALLQAVPAFEKLFDVSIYLRIYPNNNPASITIDCLENGCKVFDVSFDCIYIKGDMVIQELNETPAKFFEGYDEIAFQNTMIRVPKDYKGYLDFTYGDWHIIKKNTSFADNTISFREPLYSCTVQPLYETKGK